MAMATSAFASCSLTVACWCSASSPSRDGDFSARNAIEIGGLRDKRLARLLDEGEVEGRTDHSVAQPLGRQALYACASSNGFNVRTPSPLTSAVLRVTRTRS